MDGEKVASLLMRLVVVVVAYVVMEEYIYPVTRWEPLEYLQPQ